MKIAHVFPSYAWGGAEIYMLELAEAQARLHPGNVCVWIPASSRLEREARAKGLSTITDPCPVRFSWSGLSTVPSVLEREGVTHAVGHWSGAAWAFLGVRLQRKPIVLILHIHMWLGRKKRDLLHRFLYRGFCSVIVAGPRAKEAALDYLPLKPTQIKMIPYAVHLASTPPDRMSSRLAWGWAPDDLVCGMFARWDQQKGQAEFVHGFREALNDPSLSDEQRGRLKGVIVGDPTAGEADPAAYAARIKSEIANDPELATRLTLLPFRSDFATILAGCDILVAPSYHESYALILLHALGLDIPVLTTDSGGTPDLINDQVGWLVPPRQSLPITQILVRLLKDRPELDRRKAQAQNAVRDQHSFAAVLKQYDQVLNYAWR